MKFQDIRDAHVRHTTKASDVARQLAYAGIASLWVVRQNGGKAILPPELVPAAILFGAALFFFGAALFFDALQYALESRSWTQAVKLADVRPDKEKDDYPIKRDIHYWPDRCFWTKLGLVPLGYVALMVAVVWKTL